MKKLLLKSAVIALFSNLLFVGSAFAYISDKETSVSNTFSAQSLDFSLRNPATNTLISGLFSVTDLKPGESKTASARIRTDGTLPFQYNISAVKTSGDDGLCNALKVRATADGNVLYDGSLLSLNISPTKLLSGSSDDWDFVVSLNDTSATLKGKTCNFNFSYRGWQISGSSTTGFFDVENLTNSVTTSANLSAGDVIINEVMWMGSAEPSKSDEEWIELRNTTDADIDLTNWKIDAAGEGVNAITIPSGTISADGYFLISRKSATSSQMKDSITIDLLAPSMRLNDPGETLVLKEPGSSVIDSTPAGSWQAGENGATSKSMERNSDPSTGWHACTDSACNTDEFWDVNGGINYGTPRSLNHSDETLKGTQESEPLIEEVIIVDLETDDEQPETISETQPTPEPIPSPTPTPEPSPEATPAPSPEPEQETVTEETAVESSSNQEEQQPEQEQPANENSTPSEQPSEPEQTSLVDFLNSFYA